MAGDGLQHAAGQLGLALGLNATAVGTLIAFGSGGFFVVFLIIAACASGPASSAAGTRTRAPCAWDARGWR